MQVLSLIRELSQKFNDHVSSSSPHTQLNSAISLLQEEIQALNSRTTESIHSQLEQLEAFSNNHDQNFNLLKSRLESLENSVANTYLFRYNLDAPDNNAPLLNTDQVPCAQIENSQLIDEDPTQKSSSRVVHITPSS